MLKILLSLPLLVVAENVVTDGQTIDNDPNRHQYSKAALSGAIYHGYFRVKRNEATRFYAILKVMDATCICN